MPEYSDVPSGAQVISAPPAYSDMPAGSSVLSSPQSSPQYSDLPAGASVVSSPQYSDVPAGASVLPSAEPGGIAPYTPTVWDRIKQVVTSGLPNYSSRTVYNAKYGQTQLLSPEEAMTPGEQQRHPILTGAGEVAGGLTSPESVALIVGTGGLGELPGAAAMLPRLLSAGFGASSIYQAAKTYPEIKAAMARGDTSEVERLLTHAVLDLGMAGLATRHTATGKGAVSGKSEAPAELPAPVETRPVSSTSPVGEFLHEGHNAPDIRIADSTSAKDELISNDTIHHGDVLPVPEVKPEADATASVRSSPDVVPLRTATTVKDSYVPVVSQSEVMSEAVQQLVNTSNELQKFPIDPSSIKSIDDADAVLAQAADHIQANLDPRVGAVISFDAQKQDAADLNMTLEQLLSRKSGQAFNYAEALASRAHLEQSGVDVIRAAQQAAADPSRLSEMDDQLARYGLVKDQVTGMTAEAGRSLGSFRIDDLPATKAVNAILKLPPEGRARAAELLSKIDPANPRQLSKFIDQITDAPPSTLGDKLFEFYRNSVLSGPQVPIYKGLSEGSMLVLEATRKLVASGLSPDRYAAESYWFAKGAIDALRYTKEVLTDQFSLANSPDFEKRTKAIPGRLGEIVRFPSTVLSRQANLAYTLSYFGELNAQAARQAISEGLTGPELAARQSFLTQNPTKAMTDAANDMGLHNTFQRELGKFGKEGQSWLKKDPTGLLRYIFTFVKTPVNLVKESAYFSPYGLFKGAIQGDVDMFARGAIGSTLALGVAYLAANGFVTGGGPIQTSQRDTLESTGWQPYSIKLNGKYYSYRKMEPLGLMFALVADTLHGLRVGDTTEVTQSKADTALRHISESLRDAAFLPALAEVTQAISNPDYGWKRAIDRQVASFVPSIVQDVAHATDPTIRKPVGITETLESRIPGLTNRVPAAINIAGQPVQRPASALGGSNPFVVSKAKNDAVLSELSRLGVSTTQAPASVKRRGKPVQLTDQQRQQLTMQENQLLYRKLAGVVNSQSWKNKPDDVKRKQIAEYRRDIAENRPARIARLR